MTVQTVTAVYKNGVLKPQNPLNLAKNEPVEIQILQKPRSEKPIRLSVIGSRLCFQHVSTPHILR
jgi:predicted DNA-binding antitoxin AbrB/MazE fold protein